MNFSFWPFLWFAGATPELRHTLDGPIRANRFADPRESLDSRDQASRSEPLFVRIALWGTKNSESQV